MENNKLNSYNRILAWPNALGYLVVHLVYDMKHGDPMHLLPLPAAIFFGVSSFWLLWHIWVEYTFVKVSLTGLYMILVLAGAVKSFPDF